VNRLWHIATKELLLNRRDPLALLFTIVLPLIFTVFLGLLIPSGDEGEQGLPLALANADGSPAAEQLVERLGASPLLELEAMTASEIDAAVQDQEVAAGLIIPEGYGAAAAAGQSVALTFVRVATSSGAQSVWQAVESVLSESNSSQAAATAAAEQVAAVTGRPLDDDLLESAGLMVETQLASPAIKVTTKDNGGAAAEEAGGFNQSSTGSLVNWVLFGLLGVSSTVVLERQLGLFRRLSAAGVRAREIIGGKMLAMVVLTFLQQILLILVGQLAFGVDYFNSPLALLITMISLSLLAAAFGLLIASLFRTEQAVIATTVITALLLAALGGAWFPLEVTGAGFSRVAHILPSAWLMDVLHGITLKGWGVVDVLGPLGIVWIWIVVLSAIAIWRFRPN
jgi:ABC-2 type transport system permease protein